VPFYKEKTLEIKERIYPVFAQDYGLPLLHSTPQLDLSTTCSRRTSSRFKVSGTPSSRPLTT
jgi:hypothetical protein